MHIQSSANSLQQ